MLLVSSGYEFVSPTPSEPTPSAGKALARIYEIIGYDVGLLTGQESAYLKKIGATPPAAFKTSDGVSTLVIEKAGKKFGFVLLPDNAEQGTPPPPEDFEKAVAAAESLRKKADLVIGLSPWGVAGEMQLINMKPGTFDILLGSGKGSGLMGRVEGGGKTLWVRAFSKGKAVQYINILKWPDGKDFQWLPGVNVEYAATALAGDVADDQEIMNIIQDIEQ